MNFDKITLILIITVLAFGLSFCLISNSSSPDKVFHKINSGESPDPYTGNVEIVLGDDGYYNVVGDDGQVLMTLEPATNSSS